MSDALFDVHQNVGSTKELWDQLEPKYMAEDASSKKFLVSNFNNYKTVDSRSVMEQYHELLRIIGQFTQHGLNMDESISVSKKTLRAEESGKGKGKEIVCSSSVNMIEDGKNKKNNKNTKGKKRNNDGNNDGSNRKSKLTCWKCGKTGHFKRDCRVKKNNVGNTFGLGQGSNDPNLSQGDESTKPIFGHGNVVLEFSFGKTITLVNIVSKDVDSSMWHARLGHVHYKRMLAMSKDNLIPEFDITLEKSATYNLVIDQMDVKTTILNGDLEEEVYMKQPEGFIMTGNEHKSDKCVYYKFDKSGNGVIIYLYVDDMLIFGTDQDQVDKMKEFLSSNFSMKDTGEADVILGIRIKREDKVSTPLDPTIKLIPNTGTVVNQLEYSRAIGCLMYAMTSTRPDIAYDVGKLILEGYSDASWITNSEDHTSATGWVYLLSGGAISWASEKQTCNTDSTMEAKFVALVAAGKEAEWLKNLIYEILLWPKPISPISIHCDSVATLAKAYSQIYNEKSRHLGVIHSMVRELITNGVIFVDFVRSHQNMTDHLTKGLARDLVHKLATGMGLKSIKISNDETPNSLLASARS
ncbi:zinc finger, CCHC-type containing protein [Tanacetum coccineum]